MALLRGFEVTSTRLHFRRWGSSGPTVLALHSSGMTGQQWRPLAEEWENSVRFKAPDLLNWGESPAHPSPADYVYLDDLEPLLEAVLAEPDPVYLVGHSYGGFLALQLALKAPGKVRALALFEPVVWGALASFSQRSVEQILARFDPDCSLLDRTQVGSLEQMERFIDYWNGPGTWTNFSPGARGPLLAQAEKLFAEVRQAVTNGIPHQVYRALEQPTLLVHGTTSPPETLAMKEILRRQLPNCTVAEVEGGHMAPVRAPRPVNLAISGFLRQNMVYQGE